MSDIFHTLWKEIAIKDLGTTSTGKAVPKIGQKTLSLFEGGNIPLVDCEAVSESRLYVSKCKRYYNLSGVRKGKLFPKDTVCINQYGSGCGDSALLSQKSCLTNAVHGFNSFKEISNPRFIKYSLDCPKFKKYQMIFQAQWLRN
ncbi:restriction endonuclease subunit S domain-containing protein [Mycoplasma suis]|uniref:Putative type I restriction-modification system specificity subunit n=1 Tax=Mycoplasma suis (strain Illinois) TaxID=768700 RepID=F0QS53_MYCSL|nr:type I restriction-modification system specificity subunit [Mycoplasma suis]ADX98323.1 putative type I restriction-modification system specificity subunit [Mycoplasma suis str. Illinois]